VKAVAQFRFRILVVNDEPSIRETAGQILGSEGYEILTAADGLGGLCALSKSLPDVIISDLNMPRMSGFEFLAIVRKRFPHMATISYERRVHPRRKSKWDSGGRFLAKRALHDRGAFQRNFEAFDGFAYQVRERKGILPHSSCRGTMRGI